MIKRKLLIVSIWLLMSSFTGTSGITLINEQFKHIPLREVLQLLREKYHLKIAFGEKYVRDIYISIDLHNANTHEAFEQLLKETSMTFELVDANKIILKRKKEVEAVAKEYFELSGVVSDNSSGERLPYAYVWLEPENISLTTNVEGYFSIEDASASTKIRVSYLGYQDTFIGITDENRERRLQVRLKPSLTELEEIVVSDQVNKPNDFKIEPLPGKITMNPQMAQQMPSTGEVDVFRTLQLLPGINATNEVSSGLNINGGTSNQNLVLFDGFTVYHMDHFFGYFSAFNPLAIKSVQLYKTGFEAKYGGRVSSVVDITGKDGNRNKTSGSIGFNLLSVNTSLEIPLSDKGATLFFSGRRSYTDVWGSSLFNNIFSIFESSLSQESKPTDPMTMPPKKVVSSVIPDFYYTDMNLKLSSRLGLKNHVSFSFYDSNDILNYTENLQVVFNDSVSVHTKNLGFITWGNIGSSLKLSRQWNNSHYSNALLSYSFYESNFTEQATTDYILEEGTYTLSTNQKQNNNIEDITFNLDHEWQISPSSRIEAGIATSMYSTQLNYDLDDSVLVNEVIDHQLLAAYYLQGTFTLGDQLTLNSGIRTSFLSTSNQLYFDPRFSFNYQISDNLFLKGATGIYHQFISQSNTKNVLEGSRDFWILADGQDVPVQQSWHGLVGLEYTHNQSTISVNIFEKKFDGLLEYAFLQGNLLTEFDNAKQVFATGSGLAKGSEVMLKRDFGKFDSWMSYTYNHIVHTFPGINQGKSFYANQDQRHEFNWYGVYSHNNWEFSTVWIYGSGKPYSVVNGLAPQNSQKPEDPPAVGHLQLEEKNGQRLPVYHRMDISGSYKFNMGHARAKASMSIFNVYNYSNVLDKKVKVIAPGRSIGAPKDRRDPVITTSNVGLMGFTPNVSLSISF